MFVKIIIFSSLSISSNQLQKKRERKTHETKQKRRENFRKQRQYSLFASFNYWTRIYSHLFRFNNNNNNNNNKIGKS